MSDVGCFCTHARGPPSCQASRVGSEPRTQSGGPLSKVDTSYLGRYILFGSWGTAQLRSRQALEDLELYKRVRTYEAPRYLRFTIKGLNPHLVLPTYIFSGERGLLML